MTAPTREEAAALDAASSLAHTRDRFLLPDGLIYLDGNSLGALPASVPARMQRVIDEEWGEGLIGSWNTADWIGLPRRVAGRLAPLLGADAGDVHLGDSTSVTLFKTMVGALRMRPGRRVIVIEPGTFPTDAYVASGIADLLDVEVRWCDPADPAAAVDDDVALLALTHVDFRTGRMFDMAAVTAAAQRRGALVQWDLCHSTGAVPVDLTAAGADLAVGCTYKYLNGGPGSPAFAWVAPRHQEAFRQPITGWMGHAAPFAMSLEHTPAPGAAALGSGTPPVLALSSLDAALEAFDGVSMVDLRATSLSLTDLFLDLLEAHAGALGPGFEVVTPREHDLRGSQVSFRHPHAYGLVQALIARGVVGDFRQVGEDTSTGAGIARFGFAPLYVRHLDVHDAMAALLAVLENEEHLDPAYATRNAVT